LQPLLSICIPTYNRAGFLRVMLQALVPQAAASGGQVEVWVLDNASTDDTPAVVAEAMALGPLRCHRQATNVGPIVNIAMGPRELASGEYCWVLGDHNLLRPGALEQVLTVLRGRPELEVFYCNFRCASYPEQWPQAADGGWDGPFSYVGNPRLPGGEVGRWWELLDAESAYCTQSYAHIVRTGICRAFWAGRVIPPPFTCGLSSYPQTWLLAATVFERPTGCLTEPVLTIFNGAQSWGAPATVRKVYLRGLPMLLEFYRRQGLPAARVREGRVFNGRQVRDMVRQSLTNSQPDHQCGLLCWLWQAGIGNNWLWAAIWQGYMDAQATCVSRGLRRVANRLERWYQYCFHHCRPARWLRQSRSD
jgi:hypothetical protein